MPEITAAAATRNPNDDTSGALAGGAGPSFQVMSNLLTPDDAFRSEKFRGLVMSAISGFAANALNFIGIKYLGLSVQTSSVLFLQLVGNITGYALDILFAKRHFKVPNFRGTGKLFEGPVPYNDIATRWRWLLKSFAGKQFYRFFITVIIDTLLSLAILNWTIRTFDEKGILVDFKYRNLVLAGAIAVGTFFLYVNVLRFDWAYSDDDMPIFNVIVLMWVTLVLMIYAVTYNTTRDASSKSKTDGDARAPQQPDFENKYTPLFTSFDQ